MACCIATKERSFVAVWGIAHKVGLRTGYTHRACCSSGGGGAALDGRLYVFCSHDNGRKLFMIQT
jgi:hypothetical protein